MLEYMYTTMLEYCTDDDLTFLYNHRGIFQNYLKDFIEDFGVVHLSNPYFLQVFNNLDARKETGLYTDNGYCILSNRYVIPVKDIAGDLITLIGWYPDVKKYITLPTANFSKSLDWFNIDRAYLRSQSPEFNGTVYIVEGIFDTLMLDALGLPVIGAMGSSVNTSKGIVLNIFNKAIVIPDGDVVGQKAINTWSIPIPHIFLKIGNKKIQIGDKEVKIKDPDDLVKFFPQDEVYDLLTSYISKVGTTKGKVDILRF